MTPNLQSPDRPFDGFLIGPENALAHAAVLALTRREPGVCPLILHGPAGVGKSRLLAGLVAEWLGRHPESVLAHLSAEQFAAHCAAAESIEAWAELRGRFRHVDLLALDDLHALDRAPWAQEELAHTLDALEARGAAVAVTARTGPGQWLGASKRLTSRLISGLSARVDPPSSDARRRYLLDRARAQGLPLAAEAADLLAEAADGYRPLDGWLTKLALSARLGRRAMDRTAAEALLAGPDSPMPPTLDDLTRVVARRFGLSPRDVRSARRGRAVVEPRHLAMHLARELTGQSFAKIGAYFGGRDPKTVRHACRRAEQRLAADPALAAVVEALGHRWHQPSHHATG
jgi:chromosomal replication initiator protein